MDGIETTGKSFIEFWDKRANVGDLKHNTANATKVACLQVLSANDGWETLDIQNIDRDEIFRRFQNKRSLDFKAETLAVYRRRFNHAVDSFLDYVRNPAAWKPVSRERTAKTESKGPGTTPNGNGAAITPPGPPAERITGGYVDFPFPLLEGRFAYLKLPLDLTSGDVRRIAAFLATLPVDNETGRP